MTSLSCSMQLHGCQIQLHEALRCTWNTFKEASAMCGCPSGTTLPYEQSNTPKFEQTLLVHGPREAG